MDRLSVILGGVAFRDFEVPEKIQFGGTQRIVTHELIGGGFVLDTLGKKPQEISFQGIMSGTSAFSRAQNLDIMCSAGDIISLGWYEFFYNVVIVDVSIDYEKPWWIPFKIKCIVAQDLIGASIKRSSPIASLIASDLGVADTFINQAGVVTVSLTNPNIANGQALLAAHSEALGSDIIVCSTALATAGDGFSGIGALVRLVDRSSSLAAATAMTGYLNRAAQNTRLEFM
jgi:hypothetical protein